MSKEFIEKQIDQIFEENKEFPLNMALSSAWIIGNYKGINLKVLDLKKTSSISEYFVLGSATNFTQAKAMADEISSQMRRKGYEILSKEGFTEADWILIDFGDIIVHIFLETSREVYDLENLWADAKHVEIPQSYYFSSEDEEKADSSTEKSYF